MKKILFLFLISFCIFVSAAYSQRLTEPRLLGTWRLGYEDYGEFIYHRVETASLYLKEDPKAKLIARLCSSEKMPIALAGSHGFAYTFPEYAKQFQVPADRILFARWSKCESKSEQYWFVPENSKLDYDEAILAERVQVNRWLVSGSDVPMSQSVESESARNLDEFVAELKNNSRAEGFIIRNIGTRNRNLQRALQRLRNENVGKNRFQILRKRTYRSRYPEFMTVSIKE